MKKSTKTTMESETFKTHGPHNASVKTVGLIKTRNITKIDTISFPAQLLLVAYISNSNPLETPPSLKVPGDFRTVVTTVGGEKLTPSFPPNLFRIPVRYSA